MNFTVDIKGLAIRYYNIGNRVRYRAFFYIARFKYSSVVGLDNLPAQPFKKILYRTAKPFVGAYLVNAHN
jgi:hypothetical protein